jgi:methylase of polypeptide subunit release factors
LFLAPIGDNLGKVLDIGTGTGMYVASLSDGWQRVPEHICGC